MPKGIYPRTKAHREACKRCSANPEYQKAIRDSWTPERRAAASARFRKMKRTTDWTQKISESAKDWHSDPANKEHWEKQVGKQTDLERALRNRLKMYRYNAKKSGHIWALTDEQARGLFLSPCFFCGRASELPRLNSIDRMNNLDGYEAGNVLPCCWVCNRAKGKTSVDDFLRWICQVYEQQRRPVLPKDSSLFL
jgi:hypothetical protein